MKIQMMDLVGQYKNIQQEVDAAILNVVHQGQFINGPDVVQFQKSMEEYTGSRHVIPCANGTDALQIALMALELQPDDEVIVPAFTYVATAEVIGLLRLTPVMVDVDATSFNITCDNIKKGFSSKTKAIVPVHLFGQSCDMSPIMDFAEEHGIYVVEDNAQALGAFYTFPDSTRERTGTIAHIGCTSFFPTKNLGCYGDGGALMTNNELLATKIRMIANHGQKQKYHHEVLGCNSRLDTLQAAILNVKLKYLDDYAKARYRVAQVYTAALKEIPDIDTPIELPFSTHVYNQYTIKVKNGKRDVLKKYLADNGIPTMIYYPLPLQEQNAFKAITRTAESLAVAKELSQSVLSLPMHTELTAEEQEFIIAKIKHFFS
jgi:dTDP-4-amino-4,6-dideoxygalactose transaminase